MRNFNDHFRVFISSTFKDMDKERSYIMEWIFPRIKELCAERGVEFFPIDLRWGITEEEGKDGKIISACFEEIDNSRPFFIGLLGDRYGWQPTIADLGNNAPALLERYPWLQKDIKDGLSITEMEMQYGVLRQKEMDAAFYIRKEKQTSFIGRFCQSVISPEYNHLERLKESIRRNPNVLSHSYESVEELGEQVYQDLKTFVEQEFPAKQEDQHLVLHEHSYRSHLTNFVHLDHYYALIEEALDKLTSDHPFLALHGIKGAGKSTVLCTFLEKYKNDHPAADHILYYDISKAYIHPLIGWSNSGMLCENAFIYETKRFFKEINGRLTQMNLLNKECIIALDNIEYLSSDKHVIFVNELLKHPFPPQTKIILTHLDYEFNPYYSSDDDYTESYISIDKLSPLKINITGMKREDIPLYVQHYLARFGKKLSPHQIEKFKHPLYAINPYYLTLALFQLVELGSFEKLDETIRYLTRDELTNTFENELQRWNWSIGTPITYILDNVICRAMGDDWNSDLMDIMWVMFRNRQEEGFSERELVDIFHYTPSKWALLRPQVMELCRLNNGYIEFNDNMFSLILGRIDRERRVGEVQDLVIQYYQKIPWRHELEKEYKDRGITTLSSSQEMRVKQSLRKGRMLPIYLYYQKDHATLQQYFSNPLIRKDIPQDLVASIEQIMQK